MSENNRNLLWLFANTPTHRFLNVLSDFKKRQLKILGNWPNTYSFTKAITENEVLKNKHNLPISVFRPSIIGCTKSEPFPGWLENMNGPSGVVTGVMIGFLRTIPMVETNITDMVPADYTVNALISVMWDTVKRYQDSTQINEEPKIYNFVSSVESPLTWGDYIKEMQVQYNVAPPIKSIWYTFYIFYSNLWIGKISRICLHRIPAAFVDLSLFICQKKPKMLKTYARAESMMDLLYEFTTRQWKFDNMNTRELWSLLNEEDRNLFWFSLEEFDWKSYAKSYFYGIRKYILHEDINNLDKALAKNRKLYWLHQFFIVFVICIVFKLCWIFISYHIV